MYTHASLPLYCYLPGLFFLKRSPRGRRPQQTRRESGETRHESRGRGKGTCAAVFFNGQNVLTNEIGHRKRRGGTRRSSSPPRLCLCLNFSHSDLRGLRRKFSDSCTRCRPPLDWLPSSRSTHATVLPWMSPAALIRAFRDWAVDSVPLRMTAFRWRRGNNVRQGRKGREREWWSV